jgi:hypothetical protein
MLAFSPDPTYLENLKKQAKELLRDLRGRGEKTASRFSNYHANSA